MAVLDPATDPASAGSSRPKLVPAALRALWLLGVLAGFVAVLTPYAPYAVPGPVPSAGAVLVTTLFSVGLAARTGGRPFVTGALALTLSGAAVLTATPVLLAAATVATAVVAAILAVMSTKPAAGMARVTGEVLVATAVAVVGAFAARAYGAQVSLERTEYLVLGLALLGALVLVYRLGAGWHGLGRRGLLMILTGLVLLAVVLAYTEALAHWGSPELIEALGTSEQATRELLGGVPRPVEVLLGFPALAWGISTRARRRQGWWVCSFGAAGLAAVTVGLLDLGLGLAEAGASLGYSLLLGLLLGYVLIRADLFLTGARGRRARRLEEAAAHRPEPGRLQPLL